MSVVLIGKGKMLAAMIEGCVNSNIKIAGVLRYERVTLPFLKRKFGEIFSVYPDKILIDKYKIPEIKVKSTNSEGFKKFLIKNNVGILVVGTWCEKIKKDIYTTPILAAVNIHPSLLPKYRGPNPYLEVIMHDEKETGVTFHLMDENYDTGRILAQEKVPILPFDTSEDLQNKIIFKVKEMIPKVLNNISEGLIVPVAQDESKASYYRLEKRINIIDFQNQTSDEIIKKVRAYHPWIPCYIEVKNGVCLKIDPHKMYKDKKSDKIGKLIKKSSKNRMLTIVCADGISIRMLNLKVYPRYLSPFTNLIFKRIHHL